MTVIRLLLVDDSELFLQNAALFLRQFENISIAGTANSLEQAIRQTSSLQPDLVLLDVNLKNSSGLKVIPILRQDFPQLGIIVVTQYDLEAYRQEALRAGADDFIPKKYLCARLMPAIRRVASERAAILI